MTARLGIRYVDAGGMLTIEGVLMLGELATRLDAVEAKLAAIAAVAAPTGGATVDAQARAAIVAIIAAA